MIIYDCKTPESCIDLVLSFVYLRLIYETKV